MSVGVIELRENTDKKHLKMKNPWHLIHGVI